MTLQEFSARGQDYADLREALRDLERLKKINAELLAACEAMVQNEQCGGDGWWAGYDALRAAYARATGGQP